MSQSTNSIPRFPPALGVALRFLPLAPLSMAMTAYCRRIAQTHPDLFRRLGPHAHTRFVLDPTDIPLVICLDPNGGRPCVTVTRGKGDGAARIAGPMAALLGLVHGSFDGDALFFSRDLVIEGDTAAALALRNAVDDAELDLSGELAGLSGPFGGAVRSLAGVVEQRTGVCLTRPKEDAAW